jgi:hypothetical protein
VLGDEPKSYGGTDRGLTPYQFLAAGLGACTSMTVRMYARRKGWPLDHISVDITHDKVHAQDAGNGMRPLGDLHPGHHAGGRPDRGSARGWWRSPTNARCTARWSAAPTCIRELA